jgi:hypothetical protein
MQLNHLLVAVLCVVAVITALPGNQASPVQQTAGTTAGETSQSVVATISAHDRLPCRVRINTNEAFAAAAEKTSAAESLPQHLSS